MQALLSDFPKAASSMFYTAVVFCACRDAPSVQLKNIFKHSELRVSVSSPSYNRRGDYAMQSTMQPIRKLFLVCLLWCLQYNCNNLLMYIYSRTTEALLPHILFPLVYLLLLDCRTVLSISVVLFASNYL